MRITSKIAKRSVCPDWTDSNRFYIKSIYRIEYGAS